MTDNLRVQLREYVDKNFVHEDDVLQSVRDAMTQHGLPLINIDPYEGRLLQLLVMMSGAKTVVEIGTLAGYSGIWIARGLPDDGKLITIEKSSKHAEIARSHFKQAGLSHKVIVYQGNALQILRKIQPQAPFDMLFIDADKANYSNYLQWAVDHLRVGGTVLAHNAFWGGRILDPNQPDAHAVVAFNDLLATHPQLQSTIIDIEDGLAVGVKISES